MVIEDRDERPLLIAGLDLLQVCAQRGRVRCAGGGRACAEAGVELWQGSWLKSYLRWRAQEGAVLGLGGQGPEKLVRSLKAI